MQRATRTRVVRAPNKNGLLILWKKPDPLQVHLNLIANTQSMSSRKAVRFQHFEYYNHKFWYWAFRRAFK